MKNKFDLMLDGQHKGSSNFKDQSNREGSTNFPIFNNQWGINSSKDFRSAKTLFGRI